MCAVPDGAERSRAGRFCPCARPAACAERPEKPRCSLTFPIAFPGRIPACPPPRRAEMGEAGPQRGASRGLPEQLLRMDPSCRVGGLRGGHWTAGSSVRAWQGLCVLVRAFKVQSNGGK